MKFFGKTVFLFLILLFAGCASLPKPTTSSKVLLSGTEKTVLLEEVKNSLSWQSKTSDFKGYAKTKIEFGRKLQSFEAAVNFHWNQPSDNPDFRFELLDDFGNSHFVIVSKQGKVFFEDSNGSVQTEELNGKTLKKIFPFEGDKGKIIGWLMGKTVFPGELSEMYREEKSGFILLNFETEEWKWDPVQKELIEINLSGQNKKKIQYQASDFLKVFLSKKEPVLLPSKIVIHQIGKNKKLTLQYLQQTFSQ